MRMEKDDDDDDDDDYSHTNPSPTLCLRGGENKRSKKVACL